MAKRKKKDAPAPVAVPVETAPPVPSQPPEGEYHTITSLAALCNVTEQTVRRWLWYETVPKPKRYGRLQYWDKPDAEAIARQYLTAGGFAAGTGKPGEGGKV